MALVNVIATTGVHAITVHGRTRDERNTDTCRDAFIRSIVEQCPPNVSIIAK